MEQGKIISRNQTEINRYDNLDLMKCLAIFFVLLYHSTMYPIDIINSASPIHYFNYFFRTILSTCVPLFFLVNGRLLLNKNFDLQKHIIKTIRYVILTVLWAIITLIALMTFYQKPMGIEECIKAIWDWKPGWLNHLWFMGTLVCIYCIFPLIKVTFDKEVKCFKYFVILCMIITFGNSTIGMIATLFLCLVGKEANIMYGNFFNMFNPFDSFKSFPLMFFCVGGIIPRVEKKISLYSRKRMVNFLAGIALFFSCTFLGVYGIYTSKLTGKVWDVVWYGYDTIFTYINVIALYILCLNYSMPKKTIISKAVRIVSDNTLGVFFLHMILIHMTRVYVLDTGIFSNIFMNVVYVLLVIVFCLVIIVMLKKIPFINKLV